MRLGLGPGGVEQQRRHAAGLSALGCTDDADLARRIRAGDFDSDGAISPEVEAFVFGSVVDKLRVANPKYLR